MMTNQASVLENSTLFLHLSDIHFGQESGATIHIHNDVKQQLIEDIRDTVKGDMSRKLTGIIVSGDTAYAGRQSEYQEAGKWLDHIADAGGCDNTNVHVVPGNHDIDRKRISEAAKLMLAKIQEEGDSALDRCLNSEQDREVLYDRLAAYRSFAEGYSCPLDLSGGHAGDSFTFDLSTEKRARFLGLNSALACSSSDTEGHLILGAKQRVLTDRRDEVLIVICHHPLNWFNDEADAWKYLRRSASVFISGHEHAPSVMLNSEDGHSDILMIAAGATIPPRAEGPYNFSYNLLEFGWNQDEDCLAVAIHPRCWDDNRKKFGPDNSQGVLCKNTILVRSSSKNTECRSEPIPQKTQPIEMSESDGELLEMTQISSGIRLRFFRDLSADQRRELFIENGVLPSDWSDDLTHSIETLLFRQLLTHGDPIELERVIVNKINSERDGN